MKFNVLYLLALILFGLAIPHGAKAKNEGSFDCSKASGVIETQICASPKLSQMDMVMSKLYKSARTSFFGFDESGQIIFQVQWAKARDNICKERPKEIEACLESVYQLRIIQLALDTLFKNPDESLAAIDEYAPKDAPFYHALYFYVTEPKSPQRDNKIITLLKPSYDDLSAIDEHVKSVLDDTIGNNIADGLKDDKSFGTLWEITIINDKVDEGVSVRIMPCAALLKKPELLSALDFYYGSPPDRELPESDCAYSLPQMPNFEKIKLAPLEKTPSCATNMRFVILNGSEREWDAISVGQFDDLLPPVDEKSDAAMPDLAGRPLFDAAEAELSSYYDRYFGPGKIDKTKLDAALKAQLSQIDVLIKLFCRPSQPSRN